MRFITGLVLILLCSCDGKESVSNLPDEITNQQVSLDQKAEVISIEIDSTENLGDLINKSYQSGKVPILYFNADWCGPCKSFKRALKDERIVEIFQSADLMSVNIDLDPQNLAGMYSVNAVPTFIKLDKDSSVIAQITSAKWDEDIPKNIAPVMDSLINQSVYDKK